MLGAALSWIAVRLGVLERIEWRAAVIVPPSAGLFVYWEARRGRGRS